VIRILLLTAFAAALACAQQPAAGKSAPPAGPAKKPAAGKKDVQGVPPGAVLIEDNTWRHTDAEGKTWTYRRTPFGLLKIEGELGKISEAGTLRVAGVAGEEIEFESASPFARSRWKRARKDLTREEQAALERHEAASKAPSKAPAKDGK
jgi:hypothetical protein